MKLEIYGNEILVLCYIAFLCFCRFSIFWVLNVIFLAEILLTLFCFFILLNKVDISSRSLYLELFLYLHCCLICIWIWYLVRFLMCRKCVQIAHHVLGNISATAWPIFTNKSSVHSSYRALQCRVISNTLCHNTIFLLSKEKLFAQYRTDKTLPQKKRQDLYRTELDLELVGPLYDSLYLSHARHHNISCLQLHINYYVPLLNMCVYIYVQFLSTTQVGSTGNSRTTDFQVG